jgi:hypothetical protein
MESRHDFKAYKEVSQSSRGRTIERKRAYTLEYV